MQEMLKNLLLSMLPPGFDMDAFIFKISTVTKRVDKMCEESEANAAKIEFLGKQFQAVIYRLEPQARPIDGWRVKSYKTGEVTFSDADPTGMISPEDIAENELTIDPFYCL